MIWLSLIVLKQYKLSSVSMRPYMLDMTKVIIQLRHYGSTYKPITVSMQLANDYSHKLYGWSCDCGGQYIPKMLVKELFDNCQGLSKNLLKESKR